MLNIVIPMAGEGSRFRKEGWHTPKPLIPVLGVPMIVRVVRNLRPHTAARFLFIVRKEFLSQYPLKDILRREAGENAVFLSVEQTTDGPACTALLAADYFDSEEPLMIANCDQLVDVDMDDYLATMEKENTDGLIMTLTMRDPAWSFIRYNENHEIVDVVEKSPVSDVATVGIYNYRHGHDFVTAARQMIQKDLRVNGEFYLAPVYAQMLAMGKKLSTYHAGTLGDGVYGLGTPADLNQTVNRHAAIFCENGGRL